MQITRTHTPDSGDKTYRCGVVAKNILFFIINWPMCAAKYVHTIEPVAGLDKSASILKLPLTSYNVGYGAYACATCTRSRRRTRKPF